MLALYEHSTSVCAIKVPPDPCWRRGSTTRAASSTCGAATGSAPTTARIHPGAVVPALLHEGHTILTG